MSSCWSANNVPIPVPASARREKRSILFVIRSLDTGGAERQLLNLLSDIDKSRFAVGLVTLYDGGALRPEAETVEGIKVYSLHKRGRWDLATLAKLCILIRRLKPDIVHGYLEIPNFLCLVAGKLGGAKVVWGMRGSNSRDFGHYDCLGKGVFSLARRASSFADLAIFNSGAGRDYYLAKGYAPRKSIVIPNGIDTDRFTFRGDGRTRMRALLGVSDSHFLIGMAARFDRKKRSPDVFACCGDARA